jgi:hypothetical protein
MMDEAEKGLPADTTTTTAGAGFWEQLGRPRYVLAPMVPKIY